MALRSNGPVMVALPPFRGFIRQLLLTAVVIFFSLLLMELFAHELSGTLAGLFSLIPEPALHGLIWQFATYPLIDQSLISFLFAALSVWFFGSVLEEELGTRWMAEFFFLITIAGGLLASLIIRLFGGAIPWLLAGHPANTLWPFSLALLVAFARLHPDQELNFNFILRVKAKYMAILYLLVYFAFMLSTHERFSALVVLCNALCGLLWLRLAPRRGLGFAAAEGWFGLRNSWYRARRRRAARKFEVYMQKQGREVHFDKSGRYVDPDAERRDPNDRKWMN